ncbi:CO(2)-response secreted protease [Bienertia sinuspersici]
MKFSLCYLLLYFSLFIVTHYKGSEATEAPSNGNVYIVDKKALVHSYKHGFSGFAVRLPDLEARQLTKQPGVVSVFRDPMFHLHTTRSWDFLLAETSRIVDSQPPRRSNGDGSPSQGSSNAIIGILDTGIWPESESFNDKGMGPIPSTWKGKCVEGKNFTTSNCNKKLIGARYYTDKDSETVIQSARDQLGHGTHTASTAAGASVQNSSYYGLADGAARGGSPASHVAVYRVCSMIGCSGSAILAAFDDAIADGVDLLSLSLGSSAAFAPDFSTDPIAIGSFHAVQKGITVVCSAGNDGPGPQTVVNVAPWILTVAATTIDRDLESSVVLGNKKIIKGESINFSELKTSPTYPLIYGAAAKTKSASEDEARSCYPEAIDAEKIKGKIVLCQHDDNSQYSQTGKQMAVQRNGAVGLIIVNDKTRLVASNTGSFPMTVISKTDSKEILAYMNATENAVATILPTKTPDIAAPGVNILAAWIGNDTSEGTTPKGRQPPLYNLLSGTSMSCPHVAGIAANLKSKNPTWSPAAIRSAIMTTAIQTNNMDETITTETGKEATPYDFGAGQVSPNGGLQPGLVYDIDPTDYLQFLCYYGYDETKIKLIAGKLPSGFACPKNSSTAMISNINYPSIAITMNATTGPVTVQRTVTNVDANQKTTVYTVTVEKPTGMEVTVTPNELRFTADASKLNYQVKFSASSDEKRDLFGAITWTNKSYKVRSPFVVSSE